MSNAKYIYATFQIFMKLNMKQKDEIQPKL